MDNSPLSSSVCGIFPGKNTGVGCHFLLHVLRRRNLKSYLNLPSLAASLMVFSALPSQLEVSWLFKKKEKFSESTCSCHRWGAVVVVRVCVFVYITVYITVYNIVYITDPLAGGQWYLTYSCVGPGIHAKAWPWWDPLHFLEFIQLNSFLIILVLQFLENNH